MSDYDIHSCGYYCDRPLCIKAQRDELRNKMFSDQAVKPNHGQPTKLMGPNLEGVLNAAGYVKKKEWVGLTSEELEFYTEELGQGELGRGVLRAVDDFLKEKNSG